MDDEVVSIGVSKGIEKIELSPGEVYSGEFDILNLSKTKSVSFAVKISPYSVDDETYDANFYDRDDYNQIVDWTTVDTPSGELMENERKTISYQIVVPETAPAGGQYLSFLVEVKNDESKEKTLSLSTKSRVASILYASVAGETVEEVEILENNISIFNLDRPVEVSSLVENKGNIHTPAEYILRVYPLFSNQEIYSNEETPVENTLLPETVLFSKKTWDETPRLGVFRVVQEISAADSYSSRERIVVACPGWFLFLCLLFVFSLIFWFIMRVRERKNIIKNY
ncbi:hypothetical protein IJH66_01350 [Candidatus Saccharibacteria bacterium]|nr:hypothetical protein [Candidatus Saccharibacteria bacterium]